ncbi:YbaK/EbsC family protein [Solibacillus daqui]|uniref:YbaK/EbsC family protein n=1 Tax=Solibacillus daqui TaxID=2912187 RepID=UPI00236730B2|nr:YbaK/EbsC family protein [Solibacillus daqui]
MSIQSVKAYFETQGRLQDVLEFTESSATVEQAANVLNVIPARIAKTLSFHSSDDKGLLVVAAGDAKIDNSKFKQQFGLKAKMLDFETVAVLTGHPVGGVCPFALENDLSVFLDVSLKRFTTVFPACGSANSAIELTCDELERYTVASTWVDVCKAWQETED